MRALRFALLGLLLTACDDGGTTPAQEGESPDAGPALDAGADAAPPAPSCDARYAYDPLGAPETLTAFPDDLWTVADPSTGTGRRVHIEAGDTPWLAEAPERFANIFNDMNTLDGFGTSAPVFVTFEGAIEAMPEMHAGVKLLDLGDDVAVEVPYEPSLLDDGQTLALWPATPLRGGTPHAVLITDALHAADGGCVAPAPVVQALLSGTAEGPLAALSPRYAALLDQAEVPAEAVVGAAVWTTQTILASSKAVADDIAGRDFTWSTGPTCQPSGRQMRCEGTFTAGDYRVDGVVGAATPHTTYEIPVSIWYPASGDGPWATYILGHGLGGDRSLGGFVSQLTGDAPIVVVAIDAVSHGQHPGGVPDNQIEQLTNFFGVSLATLQVDALFLRDNFRQSTYDKLQLIELVLAHPDFDGDGVPEVDTDHVGYFGFSLGGIMGSELLALSDHLKLAILGMPGGRLSQIMRDSVAFERLINIFVPAGTSEGWRQRMFGAVQTVGERGDPVNYAPHVLKDRVSGDDAAAPHLLMVMALGDQTVPNTSTEALARGYQLPLVMPVYRGVPFLPETVTAPASATVGSRTAALAQYRSVSQVQVSGFVQREDATHEGVMLGRETIFQVRAFHQSWLDEGTPVLVNGIAEYR